MINNTPHRYRIKFSIHGDLRFIGHLDTQRLFERAFRRSGLPIRYSQGFNPKVRLNLASALPLGFSSDCELLDIWLNQPLDLATIVKNLQKSLPADIQILNAIEVSNQLPSLQASLVSSEYTITFPDSINTDTLKSALETLLEAQEILYKRRRKVVNLRPLVEKWMWKSGTGNEVLHLRMRAEPNKSGRPDELLQLLGVDPTICKIHRTNLIFKDGEEI